jgi:hypothetical protein
MEGQTESEDALVLTAFTNDGVPLAPEVSERLLAMPVTSNGERRTAVDPLREAEGGTLTYHRNNHVQRVVAETTDRQTSYLDAEADKLDRWAEDLVASLRLELRDLEKWIKELKRLVRLAGNMVEKTRFRRDLAKLESTYAAKQYEQYQKSMEIQAEKERVLDEIEAQLKQTKSERPVFTIRWCVV